MSDDTGGRMRVPRTRGAVSGVALLLLGAWGALAPFIGPYFDFAFTPQPDSSWHWTAARGWYEALPGGVVAFGGLLLLLSANRALTSLGAWLAILAGGWFVVGPEVAPLLTLGSPGSPSASGQREQVAELLAFFTALGAVVVLFGALAAGRLSVRSVRDVRAAAARRDAELETAAPAAGYDAAPAAGYDAAPAAGQDAAPAAGQDATPAAADRESVDAPSAPQARTEPVDDEQPAPREVPVGNETHDEPVAPDDGPAEGATTVADEDGPPPPPVATSGNQDAPYAPDGHTPAADELPPDATPQQGGPGYATPQRYVRRPSEQIPVDQLQRDHPAD